MTRAQRMQRIALISRRSERVAAESLAKSHRELEHCEQQLRELQAYRDEYRSTLCGGTATATSAAEVQKVRAFIAQLDTVIDGLNVKIRQCRERQSLSRSAWIKTQRRAQALDGVADRELRIERNTEETRLQREIDDRSPTKFGA